MHLLYFSALSFLLLLPHAVEGVVDPVVDAAKQVLEEQRMADADFDYWKSQIYLFRFNLDVTGNGNPELFVGSSSMVDRSPVLWSVYFRKPDGKAAGVGENLMLYPGGFYLERDGMRSRIRSVFSNPSNVTIREYIFSSNGTVQKKVQEFEGADARKMMSDEDWRDALKLGQRIDNLDVQKLLLAEYLRNPAVEWRPYDKTRAPENQNLNPSEAPFLNQVEGFSARNALQLIDARLGSAVKAR
jgi:hypothetical protein